LSVTLDSGLTIVSARHVGPKPPIVFVHGNASDRSIWSQVSRYLPDHEQVLIDLRGHGDSDWARPPAYSTADYASDIATVVRRLGGSDYVLVGHSNGGLASLYLAARLEPKPAALVLIDTEARIPGHQTGSFRQRATALERPVPLDRLVTDMLQVDPQVPVAIMQDYVRGLVRWCDYGFCLNLDPETYASWQPADLEPQLRSIAIPVTIVRGTDSRVMTEEGAKRLLAGLAGSRLVTIENAGHLLPISHAWELAELIRLAADEFISPS
jgi:pimeloyl-ACP methyl ester carboxylesterase